MNESDAKQDALKHVHADRISTGDETIPVRESVCIIRETPLTIDVEGVETYTLLCAPADKFALAVGFLLTERVIEGMDELDVLKECEDDPSIVRVRLTGRIPRIADPGRNLLLDRWGRNKDLILRGIVWSGVPSVCNR